MYLSGRVPVSTVIRGIPGKYYRVTYRINNKAATGSLISYDAALLEDGQVLEETVADSSLAGTWLKKNLEARMPQSGRMLLRFFAYHKLWNPGLFILKDFSVTEFIPEKKSSLSITLSEPNYERTLFASAPHGDIAGKVTEIWRKMEHLYRKMFPDERAKRRGKWILILSGLLIAAVAVPLPPPSPRAPEKPPEDPNPQITVRIKRKMEQACKEESPDIKDIVAEICPTYKRLTKV